MAMEIINNNDREPAKKESEKEPEKQLEKEPAKQIEKEGEKPQEKRSGNQQERPPEVWPGRAQNGELYCECEGDHKAMCLTVKFSKANKGRKYWRCRKNETERCSLYIWDSDLPTAKAWLAEHGPPPRLPLEPQTPKGKGREAIGSNTKSLQNPWTLAKSSNAKRKAKLIMGEVSDEDENGGSSGNGNGIVVTPDTESDEMVGDPHSPSRKAAKRSRQDTPGKVLSEAVSKAAADTLPTPLTAKPPHPSQVQIPLPSSPDSRKLREIAEASVRLGEVIDLTADTTSGLTIAVLDELRSAKVKLKESTKAYIGHLIDTEMELHDSRMRRCKVTMAKMKKRLDEMESALVAMNGMTDDDAVELSD